MPGGISGDPRPPAGPSGAERAAAVITLAGLVAIGGGGLLAGWLAAR